jgi:predicted naringenin-chalcone synthase
LYEWLFYFFTFLKKYHVTYISDIQTALPDYFYSQKELTSFYLKTTDDESHQRKIKVVSSKSGIESRYSVLKDFASQPNDFEFFNKTATLLPEPSLTKRMQFYKRHALPLSLKAIKKLHNFNSIKHGITDVITVTCTGLFAPGLEIELINALELKPTINRYSVNFMGCNAAIIALKQADTICKNNPEANVLVVCTELCTLHFQKQYNDDYLLSNLIFGDGAAAVLISSKPTTYHSRGSVQITNFNSLIIPNGYKDMAWELSETGFIMNLTSYVSDLIKQNIKPMFDGLNLDASDIRYWAVHPGGKRIVDEFVAALNLNQSQLAETYDVLKNYGNMSSPTVLFVLKQILDNNKASAKPNKILATAFGPGLSIETMQLEYV